MKSKRWVLGLLRSLEGAGQRPCIRTMPPEEKFEELRSLLICIPAIFRSRISSTIYNVYIIATEKVRKVGCGRKMYSFVEATMGLLLCRGYNGSTVV